jgi:tRNA A37 methylthiotransferase MiaB
MKSFHLQAAKHPCTENAMNMNLLRRWFNGNNWKSVDDPGQADVIIVATCGFSQEQEDYEIGLIKELGEQKKEGCRLIVLGCLPRINKERLDTVFQGDTVKTDSIEKFDDILKLEHKTREFHNHLVSHTEYSTDKKMSTFFKARRFFERISWLPFIGVPRVLFTVPSEKWWCVRCSMGCTGDCSFCGTKHAEFPYKSEPEAQVLAQVKEGLKAGYKEIALTGEELGAYGVDIGTDLAKLLTKIVDLNGDFEVNIRFVDPVWLIKLKDKLMPVFKTGKIKAFCTAVQSGSDRVLELMNRPYTFEQIKSVINDIMVNTPVKMISTNLIVGFPTETRDDIEMSKRLLTDVDFGMYQVYKYEEHPHTKSAKLPDKVSPEETEHRFQILKKMALRKNGRNLFRQ